MEPKIKEYPMWSDHPANAASVLDYILGKLLMRIAFYKKNVSSWGTMFAIFLFNLIISSKARFSLYGRL